MSGSIAQGRLKAYARRLGFGPNTALFARYLDALHALTGRPPDALLSEAAAFFRHRRIGEQEYARYFVLPEERLLYGLWLVRYGIQHQNGALMFVARGAEPFQHAWDVWKSILEHSYPFPDSFALRVCRGYAGDAEPDSEPKHFLSRSILSSLSDDERESAVPRHVWEQVEHVAVATGLKDELDAYLRIHWGIRDGLHGLMGGSPRTLQTALTCLADFGIDRSYRRLVWRNRRGRFGTAGITPLIQARTCTVAAARGMGPANEHRSVRLHVRRGGHCQYGGRSGPADRSQRCSAGTVSRTGQQRHAHLPECSTAETPQAQDGAPSPAFAQHPASVNRCRADTRPYHGCRPWPVSMRRR